MSPPKLNSAHFALEHAHHGHHILLAPELQLGQEVSDCTCSAPLATNSKVDDIDAV
jgi:hypothetical protein